MHAPELAPKRLQLLREIAPEARRVAVIWNKSNPHHAQLDEIAKVHGAPEVAFIGLDIPEELEAGLARAVAAGVGAAFFISDLSTISHSKQIGEAALRHQLPTLLSNRAYLAGGGLMSYGPDVPDGFRRAAHQLVRAVRDKRADHLPVEQPTKFELVINMRTARALGVAIPPYPPRPR